jgi:predicted Zn-dependent peptidase
MRYSLTITGMTAKLRSLLRPLTLPRLLIQMLLLPRSAWLLVLLLLPAAPAAGQPTAAPLPLNPFGIFETVRLGNGLKVWYGHMPGATLTSLALVVPYGKDQDPRGREQTAHFLEHVLLSDRGGRTEAELVGELTSRGGTFAGITGAHYTLYPVSIENEHAAYGLEWLHGVVEPRLFGEDLVERNREPVAVELEVRGRALLRGLPARFLLHPRLAPAGFWEREFGYAAHEERAADQHAGLAAVTAADVQAYYDTYYAPSTMTLVIVTGHPRGDLQPVLDATFGMLPWRPEPPLAPVRLREGESRRHSWHASRHTGRVLLRYRAAELTGRDHVRLMFLEDLLRRRLMQRLRSGSEKSVYSVGTFTEVRGPAAYFAIVADMSRTHEAGVRQAIDEEVARLRDATSDPAFSTDRDALARSIRVEHSAPGALRNWAMNRLYRPDLHEVFPDLGEYYATVGPDSIAAFAARLFAPENRVSSISRPLPLHPLLLAALAALVIFAAARAYRWRVFQRADMSAIRYVARLRPPAAIRLAAVLGAGAALLVLLRLVGAAAHFAAELWILPTGSFALLAAGAAGLLFAATFAGFALAGLIHAKVLVFDDELRIKSPTYRSTVIPASAVAGARIATGRAGLRLRRPWFAPASDAVFLELADGSGYLLGVRDGTALVRAVTALVDGRGSAAAGDGAAGADPQASARLAMLTAGASSAPLPVVEVTDQAVDG